MALGASATLADPELKGGLGLTLLESTVVDSLVEVDGVFTGYDIV